MGSGILRKFIDQWW